MVNKIISLFLLLLLSVNLGVCQSAPKVDKILFGSSDNWVKRKTSIYTVIYDIDLKVPVCVEYTLYHGGGECSRVGMTFKREEHSATPADYKASGYDEGHLCNAEDFAYDCKKEAQTFSFYNCAPQTPQLNRGIWKVKETSTRRASQEDSLNIIVGSIVLKKHKVIGDNVTVPNYYYRVVQSLTTKQIISCVLFLNSTKPQIKNLTVEELEEYISFKLPIKL